MRTDSVVGPFANFRLVQHADSSDLAAAEPRTDMSSLDWVHQLHQVFATAYVDFVEIEFPDPAGSVPNRRYTMDSALAVKAHQEAFGSRHHTHRRAMTGFLMLLHFRAG